MIASRWAPVAALALIATAAPAQQAGPEFEPEAVRAHVEFLADDRLEGRDAGTPGYDIAANYVAARFEAIGLTPMGGNESWYQQVPMREARLEGTPRLTLTIGGEARSWNHGDNILTAPSLFEAEQAIEAPIVFVGYGIDRPDLRIDDYAGLDVEGAIVLVLSGYPRGMNSEIGAHLSAEKFVMAQDHGAIGAFMVFTDQDAERQPWEDMTRDLNEPSISWIGPDGRPFSRASGIRGRALLNRPVAEALFAGAERPLADILAEAAQEDGSPRGFALDATARFEVASAFRDIQSANVVAMLPGSDPALADEYVVMSAHLDHIGVNPTPDESGDAINNGAMDNAAGVATMLEVARALAANPERPRRPILFVALTAEEDGLRGADYLARNPVVAAGGGEVVAVVNFDMPVLLYDFTDVIAFGAENSTLGPIVASAAENMGLSLSPDPMPEQGIFTRSDHYAFVRQGVPAVMLMTGFANGGGEIWGNFFASHYHQPSDDLNLPFDWDAGAKFAAVNYNIVRAIADADERPRWYEGNFFGDIYAPDAPRAQAP